MVGYWIFDDDKTFSDRVSFAVVKVDELATIWKIRSFNQWDKMRMIVKLTIILKLLEQ